MIRDVGTGTDERAAAESIAVQALAFLAGNGERIARFLALSGIAHQDLRAAAAAPGFLAGVLEHLLGDEALLGLCAAELGIAPQAIVAAHQRLAPHAHGGDTGGDIA